MFFITLRYTEMTQSFTEKNKDSKNIYKSNQETRAITFSLCGSLCNLRETPCNYLYKLKDTISASLRNKLIVQPFFLDQRSG